MNTHEAITILNDYMLRDTEIGEAIYYAIEYMKRGTPEGWQLVPKKPTVEMIKAAWKAQYLYVGGNEETCETLAEGRASDVYQSKMDNVAYKAMLSAAPEPQQERKD